MAIALRSRSRRRRGHTLLEILIAVAIIALVCGLVGMALLKLRRIVKSLGGGSAIAAPLRVERVREA